MSKLRNNLADALDQASQGNPVVVTRRGKTDAVLVDADLLEDILDISNPQLIAKIKESRENDKLYPLEEAFSEL